MTPSTQSKERAALGWCSEFYHITLKTLSALKISLCTFSYQTVLSVKC